MKNCFSRPIRLVSTEVPDVPNHVCFHFPKLTNKDFIVRLDAYKYEQRNPPNWGLDRIDELMAGRAIDPTSFTEGMNGVYKFDQTGLGVDVFVVDTGIAYHHIDFFGDDNKSRVHCAYDAFPLQLEGIQCCGCVDYVGHGTHMAGIIGGTLYGKPLTNRE